MNNLVLCLAVSINHQNDTNWSTQIKNRKSPKNLIPSTQVTYYPPVSSIFLASEEPNNKIYNQQDWYFGILLYSCAT